MTTNPTTKTTNSTNSTTEESNVTTIQTNYGHVHRQTTNNQGATITWEMMVEAMSGVLKPHHVEEVSYYLFSADFHYNHSFCWDNIEGVKGIGPKTLEKIKGAYKVLVEMEPEPEKVEQTTEEGKTVEGMVKYFKQMVSLGPAAMEHVEQVKDEYIEMAHGADPIGMRENYYPGKPDSFFQEVCFQMGWMSPEELEQDENYRRLASVEDYEAELALEESLENWADDFEAKFLKKQEEQAEAEARSLSSETISGEPDSEGETLNNHGGDPTTSKEDNMSETNSNDAAIMAAMANSTAFLAMLKKALPEQDLQKVLNAVNGDDPLLAAMATNTVVEQIEGKVLVERVTRPLAVKMAAATPLEEDDLVEEDNEGWTISKKEQKKLLAHMAREKARTENYQKQELFVTRGSKEWVKTHMKVGTQLMGLLSHMVIRGHIKQEGDDVITPAVIHVLNERVDPKTGKKIKLTDDYVWGSVMPVPGVMGFMLAKESHLINTKLIKILADTFPKAAEFRAYVSGLCAPGTFMHNVEVHFDKKCLVPELKVRNFKLVKTGKMVPGNPDGNGWIHLDHWICKLLKIDEEGASIQVRFWDPETGMFCKGILVTRDDKSATRDGKPAVVLNSSFVKGRMKKMKHPDKMLISGTAIQVWNRPHHRDLSRWSFELLQQLKVNKQTMRGVKKAVNRWLANFERNGGMNRYIRQAANEDALIAFMVKLAEDIGWDPLCLKDVENVAMVHARKDFYTLMQGAGIKSPTFTMVIDDGMPDHVEKDGVMYPAIAISPEIHIETVEMVIEPNEKGGIPSWTEMADRLNGRVTKKSVKFWKKCLAKLNKDRDVKKDANKVPLLVPGTKLLVKEINDVYLPGDIVLCPRYPLVTQQNFVFCVVVKPSTGVLKTTGRLAARTMRASLNTITEYNMGDADGDRVLVEGRRWILEWATPENKVENVHGGNEVRYLLEPDKVDAEKDPVAKIPTVSASGGMNMEAVALIAREGGGPIGILTYLNAMFIQLAVSTSTEEYRNHFLRAALAMAILVQEAIDRMKRTTPYTNPWFSFQANNWKLVSPNVYALPKGVEGRFCGVEWYEEGDLSISKIINWSLDRVEDIYPELKEKRDKKGRRTYGMNDIMGWREVATGDKKLDPREWAHVEPLIGSGNLVNYCAGIAWNLWRKSHGIRIEKLPTGDMIKMLAEALAAKGHKKLNWEPIVSAAEHPEVATEEAKKAYQALREKVGLKDYNAAMKSAMSMEYEARAEVRRVAQAEMSSALSRCTLQEVVTAIVMEMHMAGEGEADRCMNNVMRLASCPGNPIMDALGMEEGGACKYMAEVLATKESKKGRDIPITRAELIVGFLEKEMANRQSSGEAVTLYQMGMEVTGRIRMHPDHEDDYARRGKFFDTGRNFSHLDLGTTEEEWVSNHKKKTGVEMHRCRHCCDLLDYHIRQSMTDEKALPNRKMITRRLTMINNWRKILNIHSQWMRQASKGLPVAEPFVICERNKVFLGDPKAAKRLFALLTRWKQIMQQAGLKY